jgi:hypothetical protein
MKEKLFILCLLLSVTLAQGQAQRISPGTIQVEKVKGGVVTVDMNDKDCLHVVDGVMVPYQTILPEGQLAHFERAVSEEKLQKLGFGMGQCVIVRSSADLNIENYIYRQVHAQVQRVGTQYKMPIAVNGKFMPSYADRRSQLKELKPEQIKQIRFLDKAEAQARYGDKIVFGLIEVTV